MPCVHYIFIQDFFFNITGTESMDASTREQSQLMRSTNELVELLS